MVHASEKRYVGGDISLLPIYEEAGAKYYDTDGKPIADLIPFLKSEGMNAMRVRVFVNPENYKGENADPNACQTIENIIPLCKRIKEAGLALMIDFHYSDTWADPAQQFTPADWATLNDEELCDALYRYTRESLALLESHDIYPDFIQPGNEISYGMLWGPAGTPDADLKKTFFGSDANWERLGKLLKNAIKACREIAPEAKIVLHTERTGDVAVQDNFYEQMKKMNVDYDIIGLSYYPYFHGPLSSLENAIESLETKFGDKRIMVVETGYSYKWEVPGTSSPVDYPYSEAGQQTFTQDLVEMLRRHNTVDGLFWWWLEYNAFNTSLSGWYTAPLFDSTNGKALSALKTLCTFADGEGAVRPIVTGPVDDTVFYDLTGRKVLRPSNGIFVSPSSRKKILFLHK
ncbi:MAG: arabinogalactan endo-1,4-beta-galactosidase [Muribaculaceae bacterium]|nr:arabinogalactan endo-1,4-beta-galactosidase [Muribaculaceae bacterium]